MEAVALSLTHNRPSPYLGSAAVHTARFVDHCLVCVWVPQSELIMVVAAATVHCSVVISEKGMVTCGHYLHKHTPHF